MEKRLARSNADVDSEVQQRRAKDEKVLEVEKKMTIIRMEMKEMAMKCQAAEEAKAQVSKSIRNVQCSILCILLLRCCYAKYMPYCTAVSPPGLLCTGTWSSLSESLSACKAGCQVREVDLERFRSGWLLPRELTTR